MVQVLCADGKEVEVPAHMTAEGYALEAMAEIVDSALQEAVDRHHQPVAVSEVHIAPPDRQLADGRVKYADGYVGDPASEYPEVNDFDSNVTLRGDEL